jgi:hypothetical protein
MLEDAQLSIEPHRDHFDKTMDDHLWIPEVAGRGWIIISGDKRLESGINRVAVIESAAKVFVLSDTNSRPIYWGSAFINGLTTILRRVEDNSGPFFVDVLRDASQHVGYPRFLASGGPHQRDYADTVQPQSEVDSKPPSAPKDRMDASRYLLARQRMLDFNKDHA